MVCKYLSGSMFFEMVRVDRIKAVKGSVGTLGQIVKGIDQLDNIEVINWECQELGEGGCIRSRNIERSRVC